MEEITMPDGEEISWKMLAVIGLLGLAVCGAFFFFEFTVDKTPDPIIDRATRGLPDIPSGRKSNFPAEPVVPASQGS